MQKTMTCLMLFLTVALCATTASAAPNAPTITKPTNNSQQTSSFRMEWTDESASGAVQYQIERSLATDADFGSYTVYGDALIYSADKKFGASSLKLDGSGDYLQLADSPNWDIFGSASDTWTTEYFVKFNSNTTNMTVLSQYQDATHGWKFEHNSGAGPQFYLIQGSGAAAVYINSPSVLPVGQWHHVVLVKKGSEYGMYINGVQVGYTNDTSTGLISGPLYIGCERDGREYVNGMLDAVRISYGNPYNASPNSAKTNTITVPTQPYKADATTKLLLHFGAKTVSTISTAYSEQTNITDDIYQYRVCSISSALVKSAYSSPLTITVDSVPPGTPVLTDPGTSVAPSNITLTWTDQSASGAAKYELQMSRASDFSTILQTFTPTTSSQEVTLPGDQAGTIYFRVRALKAHNVASLWSNVVDIDVVLGATITSVLPDVPKQKLYVGAPVTYTVTATHPLNLNLTYECKLGTTVVRAFNASNIITFTPQSTDVGRKTITISVRDTMNNTSVKTFDVYIVRNPA